MTIGERTLTLIREKGMTQKEFSMRTGISQSTISEWGSKRFNPGSDKILVICDVLDVDPYYLISGTEESKYSRIKFQIVYEDSDEYQLLADYRNLSEDSKKRLQGYAQALKDLQNQ